MSDKNSRIEFIEISKKAVTKALENPRKIDLKLVNAQQARRVLDRLVGYKLSPILCKKIAPKLSAGRVQSVALKLIVDREREIESFVPEEYYTITAFFDDFESELFGYKDDNLEIKSLEEKDKIMDSLSKDFVILSIEKKDKNKKAKAPFTTSTL